MSNQSPILVTGIHRGSTSWIGRMLAASGGLTYVNEPLSVSHRPGVLSTRVKYWYTYINKENESQFLPAFQRLLQLRYQLFDEIRSIRSTRDLLRMGRDFLSFTNGRLYGRSALLKDPFASFSTPWFADRLGCRVVIAVRHPAAFASSLKRLNWPFQIEDLLSQPLLMQDHLERDRAAMTSIGADDVIGRANLLWRMLYRTVYETMQNRDDLIAVRHEDLSRDPVQGFRDLYLKLGYDFTSSVEDVVLNSSSSENPTKLAENKTHSVKLNSRANLDNWKKILSAEEIVRIRKMTEGVSHYFYSDDEWT